MSFGRFLEEISKPAKAIAEGTAKTVEAEFQREIRKASQRGARRVTDEASRRIAQSIGSLFSAVPSSEPEPALANSGNGSPIGVGGLFAPPDEAV